MNWTISLLLALLIPACCLCAVSVWKVLDVKSVRPDHLKHGDSERSTLSAPLSKSKGDPQFVSVRPVLTETSQFESNEQKIVDKQSTETNQFESNKQKVLYKQPADINQFEYNKNKIVDKPKANAQYASNLKYQTTDCICNNGGVWDGASSEERDQRLNMGRGASSEGNDQRLNTEREASSEGSDQRLNMGRGASSEGNDQRLNTEREASSEGSDQRLNIGRGASSEGSDQRLNMEREASSEGSDQRLNTERGTSSEGNGQQLNTERKAASKGSDQRLNTEREASSEGSDQRLNTEREASSEGIDQRLNMEREAASEGSDQRLDMEGELRDVSFDVPELTGGTSESSHNTFLCPPCTCSYIPNRVVVANCSNRGLGEFPLNLPRKTIAIDMSSNQLRTLNTSIFQHYCYLENLTLASNPNLTEIVNGRLGGQRSKVKVLNLTSCSIKTIQDASFDVTPELTHLIISRNALRNLTTSPFKRLGKLLHLDLSMNKISSLRLGTFNGLDELTSLDLSGNVQLGYSEKRFPPLLFKNLKQLQKLSIHNNSHDYMNSYPSRTLQDLVELMELSVDGQVHPAEFGPEMKSLHKLSTLEIRGFCYIKNITETFFQNIANLTSLTMDRCLYLVHIDPKAYAKLERLQTLSLSYMTNYKLETAFQDLAGLNNSPLSSITFRRLKYPNYRCRYLGHELSRYIQNLPLVHLDLSINSISLMGNDFIRELPPTLKIMNLSRNKFTFPTQSINDMSVLKALTVLDLSMQNNDDIHDQSDDSLERASAIRLPTIQMPRMNEDNSSSAESGRVNYLALDDSHILEEEKGLPGARHNESIIKSYNRHVHIPPNLRILRASKYTLFGTLILKGVSPENNSLSVIDFSNSFMSSWGTGKLPPGITVANLGYNYCTKISPTFFRANNSHLHLLLNNNFLGPDFASDSKGEIFLTLSKTVYLDISTNLIYSIPKTFFSGLSSLKYLYLSDNKLSTLNASFGNMKALEFIDCSKNSISWIDSGTRNDLDTIASSPGYDLTIDLTSNPLPCTCEGLELISWMATTKVHFHKEHQLTCYPDNKVVEPMGDLEKRRQKLQRLCMSKSLFIIGSSAALTVVMVIVMIGLMYRYRWKLRYIHNTAMAAMFGFNPEVSPQSGCIFDAYFVYTTDARDFVLDKCLKELEVNRGHRLCVEDRDFLPGTYIVSSIVSAVRNSTKTVVVLTPDYMEEPYCEYSFKMAVMEELYKQRTVLHLLLYQPVASDQMSHDELSLMKRNSYIEYPPDGGADEGVRRAFWDELSRVIGHSGNDTTEPVWDIE